jgi:hypothetical protein
MVYISTYKWLKKFIILNKEENEKIPDIIIRDNRVLTFVAAGIKKKGYIIVIYKDNDNYCAHSFDEFYGWLETEKPTYGYFDINLSWDDLLHQIADKHDSLINSFVNY